MVCEYLNRQVATGKLWCSRPFQWPLPPTRYCAPDRCQIFYEEIGKFMAVSDTERDST